MAEDHARSRQYSYLQNSNLVLQAERDSESRRRHDEPTGEVESLVGKINYRMGDLAQKATPAARPHKRSGGAVDNTEDAAQLKKKMKQLARGGDSAGGGAARRALDADGSRSVLFATGGLAAVRSNILSESSAFEAASYAPKSAQTQDAYEQLLSVVAQHLGAQPSEILAGTAEEVLSILKNDAYRDDVKFTEVCAFLKGLDADVFSRLVVLGKRITDFYTTDEHSATGGDALRPHDDGADAEDAAAMDKEMGVAVVFDEEDEEEESDLDEVRDDDDDDDDAVDNDNDVTMADAAGKHNSSSMRLKDATHDTADAGDDTKQTLSVHAIDAFWLQRALSKFYADADVSAARADDVLEILEDAASDLSACENRLVLLLGYDKFEFIKLVLENRAKVVYCTRLKQAQSDSDRLAIERAMASRDDSLEQAGPSILAQLAMTASADSWMQDRIGAMASTSRAEAHKLRQLQQQKTHKTTSASAVADDDDDDDDDGDDVVMAAAKKPQRYIDIDALAFQDAGHVMSNKECRLPEGTWRAQKQGFEEVHVPAVRSKTAAADEKARIEIESLPPWTHAAFANMASLNRVQSKMFSAAFETSENLLLCAPTGAGKTNVAMLTILHEVLKARDATTGAIDLNAFKIVYVAPMKALVQEVVLNLSARLTKAYGIHVRELSGDQNLSREQLFSTQIIVTTPEKWDIVTRKAGDDRAYTQLVRLVIIDEIHLLHDARGPVLEALVARTIRTVEATQQMVRLVGLSATLPNYEDVAAFLRVDPAKGLFYFDASFRPVPLQQQFIGIIEKKAIKRFALMNAICYDKVVEQAERDNQVLIFVHSRKETIATAQALRDLFVEHDTLAKLVKTNSATSEVLLDEANKIDRNDDLKDLLPFGFGVHHAGMKRKDRTLVENAFAAGHLKVLVSTATLAWGVNLPAHTVIIKGTQMYNAERGDWCELSPLDILQMLGRAGRVQYDTQGEGIVITQHAQLTYYLSLMNQQLPVESQLLTRLADNLNAEIVAGSVQSIAQAATWLGYTYLFIRMLRHPTLYGVSIVDRQRDPTLLQHRTDLVHSAATLLAKHNLIKYERRVGLLQATALGRVASHYYIAHDSIRTYNEYLKPHMSDLEILRLFSLSNEFKHVAVRSEEKLELVKLLERVPVPVKESLATTTGAGTSHGNGSAKVNVLLQAYISRLQLDGFALLADMAHIHQSAARIFRALFEICLTRRWAALSERMLSFCKMVDKRMWLSHSPLRQFASALIPEPILKRLEKKDVAFSKYMDLEPADLGQLIHMPAFGKQLYKLIHQFPRVELAAHVQPITRALVHVDLTITPDFDFTRDVHGNAEGFWIFVHDVDSETILHYEWLLLKRRDATHDVFVSFTMPLFEPLAPLYYIKVVSDKWLHAESSLPVSFQKLILPQKNAPPTELLDLQPLFVPSALLKLAHGKKQLASAMRTSVTAPTVPSPWRFEQFNPIQTQVLPRLLESDSNVFVGAPPGSGKSVLAELAIMKTLVTLGAPRVEDDAVAPLVVYLHAKDARCRERFADWRVKFGATSYWRQRVAMLTGDATTDVQLLARANIVVATPTQWDALSRRWKQRTRIQHVHLLIVDALHFVGGGQFGPTLEVVVSRMRFIAADVDKKQTTTSATRMRFLGLSNSVANARDVGEWMGASAADGIFNFHPNVRPQPLEIRVQGFEIHDYASRLLAMAKPMYNAITTQAASGGSSRRHQAIVFVPSSTQAQLSAIDLLTFAVAENDARKFAANVPTTLTLPSPDDDDAASLLETLASGVGYVTDALSLENRAFVLALFARGALGVLLVPQSLTWELRASAQLHASLVVVLGTQTFDGREHRYVDYPLADVLQMTKFASEASSSSGQQQRAVKCVLLCASASKAFFAASLRDPLPIESQLAHFVTDHVNAEVATQTIVSKQDAVDYLTWTFLYRRLMKNPNYYDLHGATPSHLSDHLSELVETTVNALDESRCLQVVEEEDDDDDGGQSERLAPLNLGLIAAYYYVQYTTIELFACSVSANSKLKALVTILAAATEFSALPSRGTSEAARLAALAKHVKLPIGASTTLDYAQAHIKTNVLLQVHFSRQHAQLTAGLRQDLDFILTHAVRLLHALVDVISSNGWLAPALAAMDLTQMVVQAQWRSDSALLQIPFVTAATLATLQQLKLADSVETPLDVLSMDADARAVLLPLDAPQMAAVATFCNAFPDVSVTTRVVATTRAAGSTQNASSDSASTVASGAPVRLEVTLEREGADDDDDSDDDSDDDDDAVGPKRGRVLAAHYPAPKAENWWVVVGDATTNALLSIKRVPFARASVRVALEFAAPALVGAHALQLFVVCDSFVGCDLENEVALRVVEASATDDEEEESEDDDDEEEKE